MTDEGRSNEDGRPERTRDDDTMSEASTGAEPVHETILIDVRERVGTLTLNRPEAMNALSARMLEEVSEVIARWEADPDVRVIVLTGSERAFAAGADIREMAGRTHLDALTSDFLGGWDRIARCRKPIVAAVAGHALGGGCEIAMMCDFILAADNARFAQPEVRIGTIPGLGGTQRLTRLVGRAKAMEMCLTGRAMDAAEAERAGLVARVVPLAELQREARDTALAIAALPGPVVQLARECVDAALETPLEHGLRHERRAFMSLFGTEDQREGMAAFIEKRTPRFVR